MGMTGAPRASPAAAAARPTATVAAASRIRRVAGRELALAWLLLAALGIAVYAPHILGGGFYLDDWANGAATRYPPGGGGFGHALSYFRELTLYRPVLVVYVPLTYEAFGIHMGAHLAWAACLAIAASGLLFAVLRTVGLARLDAWLVAALVLVFPWFDATRMWATAGQVTLGVVLYLAGLWLALLALRRRSLRLHAVSLLLFATSVLTYEIALALIAATGLLYVALAGWRAARGRWGADLLLAVAGAVWVASQTKRASSGVSGDLRHLKEIVSAAGTLLGRTLFAVGPPRTALALVVVLGAAAAAAAIWHRERPARQPFATASWLLLGASGVVVAALGWMVFVPADPYYTPSVYGMTNRVNGLAGIGLVMVAYAVLGVVGAILVRPWGGSPRLARAITVVLAAALGASYVHVVERHSRIWNRAFHAEMAALGQLKTQFPRLPNGTTVFLSGYPAYQTLGVSIFAAQWDANGAIKLQYGNRSLSAYPVLPASHIACRASGASIVGAGLANVDARYGRVRFIDVGSGRTAAPGDASACRRDVGRFVPGPLYLSVAY